MEPSRSRSRAKGAALIGLTIVATLVVVFFLIAAAGARRVGDLTGWVFGGDTTTVSHAVVVERTRAVAQLVTGETTVRDVVVYENEWLGSTKRALVVVTGKVLTGIDLERGAEVRVDHDARRIYVSLPRARVLGVEVTELRTYDEQRGLWNPFRPADRDTIFLLARRQLVAAAGELSVLRRAEQRAQRLLEELLSTDGYVAEVSFAARGAVRVSPEEL